MPKHEHLFYFGVIAASGLRVKFVHRWHHSKQTDFRFAVDWIADQPRAFWTIYKEVGSPTLKWFAFVAYEVKVSGTFRPDVDGEAEEAQYFSYDEAAKLALHDNTAPYFRKPVQR